INQEIGLAAQNATNLENALILLTPNTNIEKDPEIQKLVRKCKDSSEQLVKIIPTVMDDDKMGPLLQSNDQVQAALSKYSEHCESFSQNSNSKNISSEIKQKKITFQSQDSAKIHKDLDLIDFDAFYTSNHSANDNIVYDNSLLDDPFADPFSDPMETDINNNKSKKKLEWTEV
ncbi:21892_t:CDS:2, partial [Racocetra persica]